MKKFFAPFFLVILSGCSTLQGRPTPIVDMTRLALYTQNHYPPHIVLPTYNGQFCVGATAVADGSKFKASGEIEYPNRCIFGESDKRQYRDEVLFTYLAAVDARYRNFIMGVSSQKKFGGALASTLGIYTSTLASVASGSLATGFAASSTFMQGARGQLEKDLFYEQTLPALMNLMEAERSRTRTSILEKLRTDSSKSSITYGMAEALADVARYEDSASIERAVASLLKQAAEAASTAQGLEDKAIQDRINASQPQGS